MKQKKLKKYIKELESLLVNSNEDIKLIAMITTRLEEILNQSATSDLKAFIATLTQMRNYAWTASDYKFLDKVVNRLKKLAKDK